MLLYCLRPSTTESEQLKTGRATSHHQHAHHSETSCLDSDQLRKRASVKEAQDTTMSKIRPLALTIAVTLIAAFLGAPGRAQQTAQSRTVRPAGVTGDLLDIMNANDDKPGT